MGLDATVMCTCFAEGRAAPPPFPASLIHLSHHGYLALADDAAPALWEAFERWTETACEHPDMEAASERIASWAGLRRLQEAIEALGRGRFPVLAGELPGGADAAEHLPAARAALALDELARLRGEGAAELTGVIAPLERICQAAVATGNPVRWC